MITIHNIHDIMFNGLVPILVQHGMFMVFKSDETGFNVTFKLAGKKLNRSKK